MLIDKLKLDLAAARLKQDNATVTTLSTLLGELQRTLKKSGETVPDAVVVATIRKTVNSNQQAVVDVTAGITEVNKDAANSYINRMRVENDILSQYLPVQLTENQLIEIVNTQRFDSLKVGMAYLASNYSGRYDGSVAAKVIKSALGL